MAVIAEVVIIMVEVGGLCPAGCGPSTCTDEHGTEWKKKNKQKKPQIFLMHGH